MTIEQWLKKRLDIFELRVRASRLRDGRDMYWRAGWAAGYKAAQNAARIAYRDNGYCLAVPTHRDEHG